MKNITLSIYFFFFFISNFIVGQSIANYNISLTTIWNSTDHTSLPGGAHWSALVGATHNTANQFVELGVVSPMTDGIKNIAETGATGNFNAEVTTAIGANLADQYINGFAGFNGPVGTFTKSNIQVSENYPLITLVSMVAPSPDWFIAVNSENLRSGDNNVNNGWKPTYTIDVFAYDAGTDDGTDYGSANMASSPRVGVSMITGAPINGNKMGTITFTYNSSTLSTKNNVIEDIKIYPNPTKGKITLSNIQKIDLKSAKIFNVLGRLVKDVSIKNGVSKLEIDLSNLNKGVYLLSLKSGDQSTTKKLVIN